MMRRYLLIVVSGLSLLTAVVAFAQDDLQLTQLKALVVGNGAYGINPIEHASGDAEALGAQLKALGFEVLLRQNLTLVDIGAAVDQFADSLVEGTLGVFFYVGHGLQIDGLNYLLPIDAKPGFGSEIAEQSFQLGAVLDQLAASDAGHVVALIDAARPHPLQSRSMKKARGLAATVPPMGVTLMLADAPDTPHRFGPEPMNAIGELPQGLFTRVLMETLSVPRLTFPQLLRQVQAAIGEATFEQRRPWIAGIPAPAIVLNDPLERFDRLLINRSTAEALDFITKDPALVPLPPKPESPSLPTQEDEVLVEGTAANAPQPAIEGMQDADVATGADKLSGQPPQTFALDYNLKRFERLVLDLERLALLEGVKPSPVTREAAQHHLQTHYPELCAIGTICDPVDMVAAALSEIPQRPLWTLPEESEAKPVFSEGRTPSTDIATKPDDKSTADGKEGEGFAPREPVLSPPIDEMQRADLLWAFDVVLLDSARLRLLVQSSLPPAVKAAGKAALNKRYPPTFDPEQHMRDLIGQADPENREALVIGNGALGSVAAADMCNALEAQDFTVVAHQEIDVDQIRAAIEVFTAQLHGTRVGFFYFGGDAFAYQGENYMLPAGITADDVTNLVAQAVPLSVLLAGLEASENVFNVVVVDAPFKPALPEGVKLPEGGLAETTAPMNTLLLFAQPPNVARTGVDEAISAPQAVVEADEELDGALPVATRKMALMMADKLAPLFYRPGMELGALLDQFETRVAAATQPPQQVWWNGSIRPLVINDTLRRFDTLLTRLDLWQRVQQIDLTGQWPEMLWPLVAGNCLTGSEAVASGDLQGLIMTALKMDHTLKLDQLAWERGYRPSYINENGIQFTYVPKGEFVMGSRPDEPKRENDETAFTAILTQGFYLMRTEVTQGEWTKVMAANPPVFDDCGLDCPVEMVSWKDVQRLIKTLNGVAADKIAEDEGNEATNPSASESDQAEESTAQASDREAVTQSSTTELIEEPIKAEDEPATEPEPVERDRAMRYQLPTEAQWEYACRAGEHELFGYGHDLWKLPSYAWYKENARSSTHPVAVLKPNRWGFYDMHGNVWEWCKDSKWDYPFNQATNPVGRGAGRLKVVRGGSWYYGATDARCANRYYYLPDQANYNIGLRLVAIPK
jgi:formylglycine-generating enzyme required for sulfatase activity/uncharacterized caspase-like protein